MFYPLNLKFDNRLFIVRYLLAMAFISDKIKQMFSKTGGKTENIKCKFIIEKEIEGTRGFDFNTMKQKVATGTYENTTTVSGNSTDCYLKDKDEHQDNDRDPNVFIKRSDHIQTDEETEGYEAIPKKRNKKLKCTPKKVLGIPNTNKQNDPVNKQQKKRKMSDLLDSADQPDGRLADTTCQPSNALYGSRTSGYDSDCESISSSSADNLRSGKEGTYARTDPPRHSRSVPNFRDADGKARGVCRRHIKTPPVPSRNPT